MHFTRILYICYVFGNTNIHVMVILTLLCSFRFAEKYTHYKFKNHLTYIRI